MASIPNTHPITAEQYLSFRGVPGYRDELINGEIVMSPQPKPLHQQIVKNLLLQLSNEFADSEYVVQTHTNIKITSIGMPAPDVFVVNAEAWRIACKTDRYLSIQPMMTVEVISRSNKPKWVRQKRNDYLDTGTDVVWEVWPKEGIIRVYGRSPALVSGMQATNSFCEYGLSSLIGYPDLPRGSISVDAVFRIE